MTRVEQIAVASESASLRLTMPPGASSASRRRRAIVARAKLMQLVNVMGEKLGAGVELDAWMADVYTPMSVAVINARGIASSDGVERRRLFKLHPDHDELKLVDLDADFEELEVVSSG